MIKKYFVGLVRLMFVKAPIFVLGVWCYVFNPIVKFTTYPKIKLKNLILFQLNRKLDFDIKNQGIIFNGMYRIPSIRGSMLLMKEPDTINWINNYFKEGDLFFDIGANIGVYSLYAHSLNLDISIVAFEPESSNFFILNDNIRLNKANKYIKAYNIAVNDSNFIGTLSLSDDSPGKSGHDFKQEGRTTESIDQGVIGISLDDLIETWGMGVPNHIKIDVDGNEGKIISGMKNTLKDNKLKSLAIELDFSKESDVELFDSLKKAGFVSLNDSKYQNPKYLVRNYFFVRDELLV
jgi:FkbM family methyltransferase